MHCPTCRRAMMNTSRQTIQDEKGLMTISRWRCRLCHETAEEIRLSAGYDGQEPTTIQYAVAVPRQDGRSASLIRRGRNYAGTF